jgi:protein-disulfide isomerase
MTEGARRERRQTELAARRDARRAKRSQPSRSSSLLLPLSVLAIVAGLVVVGAIAWLRQDVPPSSLTEPLAPSDYSLAVGRTLGLADAPVTLEVWSDYQCPFCGFFATTWERPVTDQYAATGQLRIVYRDFAFIGPESLSAATAARCADAQGSFWQYHDYLFANQNGENKGWFSTARLAAIAQAVGLNLDTYNSCLADPSQRQAVQSETTQGRAQGVSSTPTLSIDGQLHTDFQSYGDLTAAIDAELAKTGQ